MIRLKMMMGVARAESRLTRRLVRYWVFMLLACGIGLIGYAYYSFIHYRFSSLSGTVGSINPRYLVGAIGFYYLFVFLIGLLFLCMDVRGRDIRERMVEVLDALPCSNLELVLGKYLGVLIPSWVPLVIVTLLIFGAGFIWGESVNPYSLVYFVFFMAIPAFTFIIGLVYLVSLLVRHRGLASVLLLIIMAGIYFANFRSPVWLAPATDMIGGFLSSFPSDMIPEVVNGEGLAHRIAIMLLGLGFLWLAAGFHPRKDDGSFARYTGVGLLMVIVGMTTLGGIVYARKSGVDLAAEWKAAHEARLAEPAPDVTSIKGNVVVEPGDSVSLDLEIAFRSGSDIPLDNALFSLNPGIVVSSASDESGKKLSFEQENGILEFKLNETLVAGVETTIRLQAEGEPAEFFGYLDGAKDPMNLTNTDGQLFLLGFVPVIFRDDHVSLLPGSRWLPSSGVDVGHGDPRRSPTDFFAIDLTVAVPEGWIAALPGRRQDVSTDLSGMTAYRFTPGAPVDQVALIADEYESRSVEINGVQAEILLHPSHASNLELFSDSTSLMKDWMAEKLDESAAMGLPYPYDGITVVEVPNIVRGYGGGWRLGSTLAPSATIVMKESGFPTSRFDHWYDDPSDFEEREGGMPQAKFEQLERFFDNDFNGGNPFAAVSRNFFSGLTTGEGPEGLPLDFVFEELSSRLVMDKHSYFSAYLFTPDMQLVIQQSIGRYFQTGGQGAFVDSLIDAVTSRSSVWDKALDVSLDRLDPWEEPQDTVDILILKGGAMAQSMIDGLGREETGAFLAALRETGQGGSYNRQDVLEAGFATGTDLTPWLNSWISQTNLPGFLVKDDAAEAFRLEDTEDGSSRYQILVRVTNGEEVPGLLRVDYVSGDPGFNRERGASDPVNVPGGGTVEIGLVSSKPPATVIVTPYLSLNRTPFTLGLGSVDSEDIRDGEPFIGSRMVEPLLKDSNAIVVDDLDDGFAVAGGEDRSRMRIKAKKTSEETDRGLPVFNIVGPRAPSEWSRATVSAAYGKYRHTFALVKAGKGDSSAVFTTEIPEAGSWDLEVYYPQDAPVLRFQRKKSSWNYVIEDDSGSQEAVFDTRSGEAGWNSLGSFELAGGETRVILPNETEGRLVIADAIRWVPSSGVSIPDSVEE